jgi:hypothetical protein
MMFDIIALGRERWHEQLREAEQQNHRRVDRRESLFTRIASVLRNRGTTGRKVQRHRENLLQTKPAR